MSEVKSLSIIASCTAPKLAADKGQMSSHAVKIGVITKVFPLKSFKFNASPESLMSGISFIAVLIGRSNAVPYSGPGEEVLASGT